MGWFDDIVDTVGSVVSGVGSFMRENPIVGSLLSTVVTGFALNKITDSISSDSATNSGSGGNGGTSAPQPKATDFGVPIQVPANQDNKIPVFYGTAVVGGIVTEAVMSNNRQTMTYVITICEKTGAVNLGAGAASVISFQKIYWNDMEVVFQSDGITVSQLVNSVGDVDPGPNGIVKIWCYNNGSSNSTSPVGYSAISTVAYDHVPNWDGTFSMDQLVFIVIQITYNKEKNVTGLPTMKFLLSNTLKQPGDVMYDYMTNTRYGAGIAPGDITI
jgi:hypothetical protein